MIKKNEISYKNEILRKVIHLLSLSIPISYIFFSRETELTILIPMAVTAVLIDVLSKKNFILHDIMYKYFGNMLRPHEQRGGIILNGASWVLISAVVCVLIFPKIIMVTGFTILIVSDIMAALIGRKYGRHAIFDKSLEGLMAFIISAIAIVVLYGIIFDAPPLYFLAGIAGAIVGGFGEVSSSVLKMDDNLSVPLSVGIVMWIIGAIAVSGADSFFGII